MSTAIFLSAVSDEFHKSKSDTAARFTSYRDALVRALDRCGPHFRVIVQESLAQGFSDLLETLDQEIRTCAVVVHLVGHASGKCPEDRPVRKLRERYRSEWLADEPELRESLGERPELSYTQWEIYLAYHHDRRRLVYVANPDAPRAPGFDLTAMTDSQVKHFERLKSTGEHRETFENQLDLALNVVTSLVRYGLAPGPNETTPSAAKKQAARDDSGGVVRDVADGVRNANASLSASRNLARDAGPVPTYLMAVDATARKHELDRQSVLEIAHEHRQQVSDATAADPSPENLRELAFAELAVGKYPKAMAAAKRQVDAAIRRLAEDPDQADRHREDALNAHLLLHEAANAAGRPLEAIEAMVNGGALIDRERDPVYWANYHEPLARYFLRRYEIERAQRLIDEITDIREEHPHDRVALATSLLLWASCLNVQSDFRGAASVASRAEGLFDPRERDQAAGIAAALGIRGHAYVSLGSYGEAEPLLRRALVLSIEINGRDHPSVADDLCSLASMLLHVERTEEAEKHIRRALAIDEEFYEPTHPVIAGDTMILADALRRTHRFAEAEPLYRRAMAIDEEAYGSHHASVARCLYGLGLLLDETDRFVEAESTIRRGLAINEKIFGSESADVVVHLLALAGVLNKTQRREDAELLLRRALAIKERWFGSDHPGVSLILRHLGTLLFELKRSDEAVTCLRRALEIDENRHGQDSSEHATSLRAIALMSFEANRLGEAEALYRRVLAIHEKTLGANDPNIAEDLRMLAWVLEETNRLAEAEPMLRRSLAIYEGAPAPDLSDVARVSHSLGGLLRLRGQPAEAERLLRRAVALDETTYGKDHQTVAPNLTQLAMLLIDVNQLPEAEELLRRSLAIGERTLSPDHDRIAWRLNYLGMVLLRTNCAAEAEPMLRRALAINEKCFGVSHPKVAFTLHNLAVLLSQTNRPAEAEATIERAVATFADFVKQTGFEHPQMRAALDDLTEIFAKSGRTEADIVRIRQAIFAQRGVDGR